jgi:hypothetical protein
MDMTSLQRANFMHPVHRMHIKFMLQYAIPIFTVHISTYIMHYFRTVTPIPNFNFNFNIILQEEIGIKLTSLAPEKHSATPIRILLIFRIKSAAYCEKPDDSIKTGSNIIAN